MDNLVERWPGYNEQSWAQRFAELDRRLSKGQGTEIEAICQLSSKTSARITALEASLAEAEGRVIAEVVAWVHRLHDDGTSIDGMIHRNEFATALETGEWKK